MQCHILAALCCILAIRSLNQLAMPVLATYRLYGACVSGAMPRIGCAVSHTGLCNACTSCTVPHSGYTEPCISHAVLCHILPIQRPVSAVPCCVLAAPCHLLVIGRSVFVGIPCQRLHLLHHRGLLNSE